MKTKKKLHLKTIIITLSILCNCAFLLVAAYHWSTFRPVLKKMVKSNQALFNITKSTLAAEKDSEKSEKITIEPQDVDNLQKLFEIIQTQISERPSETERIDYIRQFVYENSLHKGGAKYVEYTKKVLSMMYEFHLNNTNPPHLTCGSRTLSMKALLDEMDIENRRVQIFTDSFELVRSHTFLEAFNRDTQRWEIQDPDKNLYYRHVKTLKRASIAQLVWSEATEFEPCSPESGCGWEINNLQRFVDNRRFGAIIYHYGNFPKSQIFTSSSGYEKSVLLINTDRFSVTKQFPGNDGMTFIEFANKHYSNPVIILNQQFE